MCNEVQACISLHIRYSLHACKELWEEWTILYENAITNIQCTTWPSKAFSFPIVENKHTSVKWWKMCTSDGINLFFHPARPHSLHLFSTFTAQYLEIDDHFPSIIRRVIFLPPRVTIDYSRLVLNIAFQMSLVLASTPQLFGFRQSFFYDHEVMCERLSCSSKSSATMSNHIFLDKSPTNVRFR